jgi:hypothetical protein
LVVFSAAKAGVRAMAATRKKLTVKTRAGTQNRVF